MSSPLNYQSVFQCGVPIPLDVPWAACCKPFYFQPMPFFFSCMHLLPSNKSACATSFLFNRIVQRKAKWTACWMLPILEVLFVGRILQMKRPRPKMIQLAAAWFSFCSHLCSSFLIQIFGGAGRELDEVVGSWRLCAGEEKRCCSVGCEDAGAWGLDKCRLLQLFCTWEEMNHVC